VFEKGLIEELLGELRV